MASKSADPSALSEMSSELLQQASDLERLVQRLLLAEGSVFTREVARFGLTVPQYQALSSIEESHNGRQQMGHIAQRTRQCSATMTGIVDRLEALGLVQRQNNPNDRRSKLVLLTDSGSAKLQEVRAARYLRLAKVLAGIAPDMRRRMQDVLLHYASPLDAYM